MGLLFYLLPAVLLAGLACLILAQLGKTWTNCAIAAQMIKNFLCWNLLIKAFLATYLLLCVAAFSACGNLNFRLDFLGSFLTIT